jgi:hypothetical protein
MPLEVVVLEFEDTSADTVRALVDRMNATGQVRVISAVTMLRDAHGVASVDEWLQPHDLFDLTADLAARRMLDVDHVLDAELAACLEPGTTLLFLVLDHLWARAVYADVQALGGHCVTSRLLPTERIQLEERRITAGDD